MKIELTKDEVAEAVATHLKSQLGIEAMADEIKFTDSYRTEFASWESAERKKNGEEKVATDGE